MTKKMKVEIELIEGASIETNYNGWKVTYNDKYADNLGFDEMLGLVAAITLPKERPTLQWLQTAEQHEQRRENLTNMNATEQGILNEQINVQITTSGNERLKSKLLVVSTLGAKLGRDGDYYYYIIGDLPNRDCVVGYGETPLKALDEFCKMYGL